MRLTGLVDSLRGRPAAPSAPWLEIGAYEALWLEPGASFKTVYEWIAAAPTGKAAELVPPAIAQANARDIGLRLKKAGLGDAGLCVFGSPSYPAKLGDARYPLRAFYYRGDWDLVRTPSVAVVGARQIGEDGAAQTRELVRCLVEDGFTIVSGLAAGTDGVAHRTALEMGGRTVAVLGTAITDVYPKAHADLQRRIGDRHLVISQVPIILHASKDWRYNRRFFPERNITMCALTDASIITAIGQSNGTYIQSKAALHQGRPLFLLNACFSVEGVDWPARFARRGATRVHGYEDIRSRLCEAGRRR